METTTVKLYSLDYSNVKTYSSLVTSFFPNSFISFHKEE